MLSPRNAQLRTLLALCLAAAACNCSPDKSDGRLVIESPKNGTTLNAADDMLPDVEGLQIEVVVAATLLEGRTVTLEGTAGTADSAPIVDGKATLVLTVTGAGTLGAVATDGEGVTVRSGIIGLAVDDAQHACRIISPADGAKLGKDDDVSSATGFQHDVQVRCAGVETGNPLALSVNGGAWAEMPLGAGGLVSFPEVELQEGENKLQTSVLTDDATEVTSTSTVTVDTGRCRVAVLPISGTVFNARGEAGGVADREPGAPMNAVLTVETRCKEGEVELRRGTEIIASAPVQSRVEFPVELDDGLAELRAVIVANGSETGASPLVRYLVDSVDPTALLSFPTNGQSFSDAFDRDHDEPGLQIAVRGAFEGIEPESTFDVVLTTNDESPEIVEGVVESDGSFEVLVTLPDGSHELFVRATRESGTTAKSSAVKFSSAFQNASFIIESPLDGAKFSLLSDADPGTAEFEVAFRLSGSNLAGKSGTLNCSGALTPFTLDEAGSVEVRATVDVDACEGRELRCSARLVSDGVTFDTPSIDILVDPTPAEIALLSPQNGSTLPSALLNVEATTTCTGEEQTYVILNGVDVIHGPLPVERNAIKTGAISLPPGESELALYVTDAGGNGTTETFRVFVDDDAPQPVFLTPQPAPPVTLSATDDTDADLSNGFQHPISVEVANEAVGTLVEVYVGDRAPIPAFTTLNAEGRHVASFTDVSFPEGAFELKACATDEAGSIGCQALDVVVDTGRLVCDITTPADGRTLGVRDDTNTGLPGIQPEIAVTTTAPDNASVSLLLEDPSGVQSTFSATVSEGIARLSDVTLLDEGTYVLSATCPAPSGSLDGHSLPSAVRVAFVAPAVTITAPTDGTLFNTQSPDRGADDGFQIDVRVSSPEAAPGTAVELTVVCDGETLSSPALAYINSLQEATFRAVDVPDVGECTLSVVLEDAAGNRSEAATTTVTIDREPPVITFSYPSDGDIFGKSQDASPQNERFELQRVEATITGGTEESVQLRVGTSAVADGSIVAVGAGLKATWNLVELNEGLNELVVTATDDAGNIARKRISVSVRTLGPVVKITNIVDGRMLRGRDDTDTTTPGLQYGIRVGGERLGNGTTVRICSEQGEPTAAACENGGYVLGSSVLSGGGSSVPNVTLPEGNIEIYAEAIDLAGNKASSPTVSLYVDSQAPVVQSLALEKLDGTELIVPSTVNGLLGPNEDSAPGTPGFRARLRVQVSDGDVAPNGLVRFMDSNPAPNTQLGSDVVVDADGIATLDVTLADGGHRIHVVAVDKVGNTSATPETPGADISMLHFAVELAEPVVVITSPRPGALLARNDADPSAQGLQYDVTIATNAGPGHQIELLLDGTVLSAQALGYMDSLRVTLPEGAHVLTARVTGAAGNVGTSAPVSLVIDSIAPVISITQPTSGATISTDAEPGQDGFQITVSLSYSDVESGRPVELHSSTDGIVAVAETNGGGTILFAPVTVSSGAQTLTARVSDAAGNETLSAPVSIRVDTSAPSAWFVSDNNPLQFGLSTRENDGFCHVAIKTKTDADGVTIALLENGVAKQSLAATGRGATFNNVIVKPGTPVSLQLRATGSNSKTGYSTARQAYCDLTSPTVSFVDPSTPTVTYVAYGNPGNVADSRVDILPSPTLDADFTVNVGDAGNAVVELLSDRDGLLASRSVSEDGHTVFSSVSVPSAGTHEITARVTNAAGNASEATFTAYVDVRAPSAANPQATVLDWRNGRVKLTFPAPDSDAASGGAVAGYEVRMAKGPINAGYAWDAAAVIAPSEPVVVKTPGAMQEILLAGLALERQHYFAVRAVDAIGNLAPLGATPVADLRLRRNGTDVWSSAVAPSVSTHSKLVIADLNGDGYDDVIVSNAQMNGDKGEVQIIYGGSTLSSPVTLEPADTARFGTSLAVGDINGDGFPDLLVGAQYETTGLTLDSTGQPVENARDGAVHVYFGSANTKLSTGQASDVVIQGQVPAGDLPDKQLFGFGFSVAVVDDLTGDGIDDIVIGAPGDNGMAGRVFVIAGRFDWPATLPAVSDARAILASTLTAQWGPWFGHQIVSLGDVNGDGMGDFAISAPGGGLNTIPPRRRPVFLVSGALATGQVQAEAISHAVYPNPDGLAYTANNQFGAGLETGDFTGDGLRDLAVLDLSNNRFFLYSGAEFTVPDEFGGPLVDASSSRLLKSELLIDLGTGTPTLSAWRDINGDGVDEISTSFQKINATWGYFGRSASEWRDVMFRPDDVTAPSSILLKRGPEDMKTDFGIRSGSGHILSTDGPRDIAVLSLGGRVTVLRDP